MFGRVSTVPLWAYANSPFSFQEGYPTGSISSGIILGKKGDFTYGEYYEQSLSGWYEPFGPVFYPEYEMPDNIPEWINAYNPSTHIELGYEWGTTPKRLLIGDGTNSIGPHTLQEALYIYSVLKTYAVDDYIGVDNSIYTNYDEQDPRELFYPNYKGVGYGDYFSNEGGFYSEYNNGYGSGQIYIVADVDNLSDYYIASDSTALLFAWRGGGDGGGNYYVTMDTIKYVFEIDGVDGVTLSEVGDSYSITTEEDNPVTTTITYIGCTVSYTFGPVSGTVQLYGLKYSFDGYDPSGEGDSFDPSYPSTLSVSGIEFWPYKNANGQPVYNETTGAIINPPIP